MKKLDDVKYIVVHCSATPPDMDVGVAEIDRWHRQRGFLKIGYHYVIRRNGTVEHGRSITEIGAHEPRVNAHSVAICLVGGVNRLPDADGKDDADGPRWDLVPAPNFAPDQMRSLRSLIEQLRDEYFPNAEVIGHRDVPGVKKDCPCFDVKPWWAGDQRS